MKVTGNELIELVGLPDHDASVIALLAKLTLKRPVKDRHYDGVSIIKDTPDDAVELSFDESLTSDKQKNGGYGPAEFYLNAIMINKCDYISPPFNISWQDSYAEITKKLNRPADFIVTGVRLPRKIWLFEHDNDKYFLTIDFDGSKEVVIRGFDLVPFDSEESYLFEANVES